MRWPIRRTGTELVRTLRKSLPTRKPHIACAGAVWVCHCDLAARLGATPGAAYAAWAAAMVPRA